MMNDNLWREELIKDSDRYRDKWAIWKSAYYAGTLTVSGVLIAIAPQLPRENCLMHYVTKILLLLSVISCACVISNMLLFIRLYEALGFNRIPYKYEEMKAYHDRQDILLSDFTSKRRERKLRDHIILGYSIGSASCLAIALFL
ncbi:MAG: hypothetical protein NTX25_19995 [Proteobacteria bacterium]|nr:hypothetical protein [Pseudomonadota bacterium]